VIAQLENSDRQHLVTFIMKMTSTLTSEVNDDGKIYRLNQHIAAFISKLNACLLLSNCKQCKRASSLE